MTRNLMNIRVDDLRSEQVVQLLRDHLDDMMRHSPPESVHALDIAALRAADILFWTAWDTSSETEALMGCAALKTIVPGHGEVKSMRTNETYLRRGVARRLLNHLIAQARLLGLTRLSLETGSAEVFAPARSLYASAGFVECGPFAEYKTDPFSVFMTLTL